MALPKKRRPLIFSSAEKETRQAIRKARSEQKRRTVRAGILLDGASGTLSDQAIARAHGVNRNTVVLCIAARIWTNRRERLVWRPNRGQREEL